ncbi:MAG: hypothetical protein ACR2NN_04975 [Bryobacteraceae bacterium]
MMRTVAPFVPVALALLASHAVIPSAESHLASTVNPVHPEAPAKCGELADFRQCHSDYPSGCSLSAGYDGYLNLLKNQDMPPPPPANAVRFLTSLQDYQALEAATPADLSRDNHLQFKDQLAKLGEGQIYGVVGYLYYAKESGKESSNCELGDHDAVDYHIGIGFDPSLAPKTKPTGAQLKNLEQNSAIVEMTPHYRFDYHPNWNIQAVQDVAGKKVRVVGQLMIDSEHNNASQNCGFQGANRATCWRATSWELHPVMQFQVCNSGECTASSGDWIELDQAAPAATPAAP